MGFEQAPLLDSTLSPLMPFTSGDVTPDSQGRLGAPSYGFGRPPVLPFSSAPPAASIHQPLPPPLSAAGPPSSPSGGPQPEGDDAGVLESMLLWTLREPATIALTLMYCASFALGFAGNLMSLHVLTGRGSSRRRRRLSGVSATRSLLVNLAVCDLAVVCVCMPVTLGIQIYRAWVYGDLLCRAVPFTQAVSVSASVLTLTVISVNRYYSGERTL